MTLQEFLSRCTELENSRNPAAGLVICDEYLATARGRQRAAVLRQKAAFLLMSNQGWVTEALTYLKEALELLRSYPTDQPPVLNTLVAAYAVFGGYDIAHQYAAQYFELVSRYSDAEVRKFIPKVWYNLAYAYDAAGQYDRAAEAYSHAYEEALKMPEAFSPGKAAHNLVQMYLELGRIDDALVMLQASKPYLDESQSGAFMKNQEALCFLALGRYDEAVSACKEALAHPMCSERVRAEVTFTLARVAGALANEPERESLSNQALDTAIRLPHPRLCRKIELFLTTVRNREGVPEP